MSRVSRNHAATLPLVLPVIVTGLPNRYGKGAGDTRIPLGPLTIVDMRDHAGRKGRTKQKIGMWGNLSQTYHTSATIDSRWSRTMSDPVS